jgi:hypothetical protein
MAISAQQRQFLTDSLRKAIAKFYGEDVPPLRLYTRRKRATFIDKLKERLSATLWYSRIADAKRVLSHADGVHTKLQGNYRVAQEEQRAERDKELAEVEARYQAELKKLTLHYEPKLNEQQELVRNAKKELSSVERASYFAALEEEDDGRHLYHDTHFDKGIEERVDRYIENSLDDDELGKKVAIRLEQEQLVGDVAFIEKSVETMRTAVLGFITSNDLPPITMKAWHIIAGKDARCS